jgi:hypothetical protein
VGGFGWDNPFPFELGGGPTDTEAIYLEMRKAIGEGAAGPADSAEDVWRQCKAATIAAAMAAIERAALQALPLWATDHLEVYETLLRIPRAATTFERQVACAVALTEQLGADIPSVRVDLKKISAKLDVDLVAYAQALTTVFGKMFAPRDGSIPYGSGVTAGLLATGYPNCSTDFVLHVRYTLDVGETIPPADLLARARRYLCNVLPAWVDFAIYTGTGFYLDGGPDGTSLLDLTAFS